MATHSVTLADFTMPGGFDPEAIETTTRKFGAAVLPQFVTGAALPALQREFSAVLEDNDEAYVYKLTYPAGRAASLTNNETFKKKYKAIAELFDRYDLVSFAHRYIGTPCLPNQEIYATHERVPDSPVAPTHFDKLWNLKFMFYVDDVGQGNAPFGIVPGSAVANREAFRRIFEDNQLTSLSMSDSRYQGMSNSRSPEQDEEVVEITAPAGTLIVFDTDTSHRARPVEAGKERRILRGHSGPYAKYERVKKYSRQWWRGEKAYSKIDEIKDKVLMRA